MSVFAASFHTFMLMLLSSDAPKLRPTAVTAAASGELPHKETSTLDSTGWSEHELKQRIEYVLHDRPITASAEDAAPALANEHDDDEADDDAKQQRAQSEQAERDDDGDELEITHMQAASSRSSVLSAFCAFASTKLAGRSAATIRQHLQRSVGRIAPPVASTAASSHVNATGRGQLTATPHIAAYIAAQPETASLLSMLKRSVLEPHDSYDATVPHDMVAAYDEQQIRGLLAAMKADRWITRRKNMNGEERSWKVGQRTYDLLFNNNQPQQQTTQKQTLQHQWADMALGRRSRLLTPISQLQVEAVIEALHADRIRLPLPKAERMDAQLDERTMRDVGVSGEGEEKKGGGKNEPVDPIVESALHAARWDFAGDGVSLINTHWRLSEQPSATQQLARDPLLGDDVEGEDDEADADPAETLLVRLLEDEDEDEEDEEDSMEEESSAEDDNSDQQLCDQLVNKLVNAGPAGLTRKQLQLAVMQADEVDVWDDGRYDFAVRPPHASPFDRALQRGLLHRSIIAPPSFDQQRFAADSYADYHAPDDTQLSSATHEANQQWAAQCRAAVAASSSLPSIDSPYQPRALVSHTWRLLNGDINQPLLSSLYSTVLDSVRRWPGVTEQRLCALLPVLTVAEVRHVLQLLVLDDLVHARWLFSEVRGQGEGEKRLERLACYHSVDQQL